MENKEYPFRDSILPIEKRVENLISLLTPEEKISQLLHESKEITRLGIPEYNWWNECLHGVGRAGTATVFPQPIGLGATFDRDLLHKIGSVVSDEARIKFNIAQESEDRALYKGLTFWSPNINIYRDPRWGRGHETYGEDPFLTGELGLAFIKGLQGDNKTYLKVAACAKHFAVHSGPEKNRHSFNVNVDPKDLHETYLPAFKKCVMEGKVEAVMGAYNRVNGVPCCGSKELLENILRKDWGFLGHVVSDCGAICDFHEYHKITKDSVESSAMALKAGSDLNCGETYSALIYAFYNEMIEEEDLNRSLKRVLTTRFKLGLFDTPEDVPYSHIPFSYLDQESHHQLSYQAALKSMVLLKNDSCLPLDGKKIKSIALIGPNCDDPKMLLGNYSGTPSYLSTPLQSMIKRCEKDDIRVYYSQGCSLFKESVEPLAQRGDRISEAQFYAKKADMVVLCVGLSSEIEGEAGDAFNSEAGGDRFDLKLPGEQENLIHQVLKYNSNTVIVNFSGGPVDLGMAHEKGAAVIQAWYPGPQGGDALISLIFGDQDFSGKLPISFVHSHKDLPPFDDYSMKGRTYKFHNKAPLYNFGYGLSYNDYNFYNIKVNSETLKAKDGFSITFSLENTGPYNGEELCQIYLAPQNPLEDEPLFRCIEFKKVCLSSKEKKEIQVKVSKDNLLNFNHNGESFYLKGSYSLIVGNFCPSQSSLLMANQNCLIKNIDFI